MDLPNPDYANPESSSFYRVNSSYAFEYLTTFDIRTLSTNGVASGDDVSSLLYTPDLLPESECINASAPYVPANATRLANLPDTDYDLVAIAPWLSPQCVQEYLSSAREIDGLVRGFLFYLPSDNGTETPPEVNSQVWGLGDGGSWKRDNNFPVYAIPGASAGILMEASALYSQNLTDVPYGNVLVERYNSTDYVRLLVDIDTGKSSQGGHELPSRASLTNSSWVRQSAAIPLGVLACSARHTARHHRDNIACHALVPRTSTAGLAPTSCKR